MAHCSCRRLLVLYAVGYLLLHSWASCCYICGRPFQQCRGQRRHGHHLTPVSCHATKGFGDAQKSPAQEEKKVRRSAASPKQLKKDHGAEHWEAVMDVLSGKRPAHSPEEMVRARFSAIRSKNADFMGKSERNPEVMTLDQRQFGWKIMLGLEPRGTGEPPNALENALASVEHLEMVGSKGERVEYKMHCGENGILHERAIFQEDSEMGWVYSGKSEFFDLFPADPM
eukprot:gb/GFBE01083325.1/.p1 GENE.gb/GFBE01083325.1/~~gb/GFBE01083325.1/.p1  ORF type:complete len:227 (+),score=34.59 gb/GFBE01083325.1/:1-681(+)